MDPARDRPSGLPPVACIWRLALAAGALLAACGVSPETTPTLDLSSPADGASVNVGASGLVAVNFSTNFTLRAPGACQGADACGHLFLLVDSSNCNLQGQAYNALAISSPTNANLGLCATVAGTHTITLELRHDDGSRVNDLAGNAVTASAVITALTP